MAEPVFLDFGVVEDIHEESLAAFGGSAGVRDRGLIESALGAAQNAFYYGNGDFSDIAAAYAFTLLKLRPFSMETSEPPWVPPFSFYAPMECAAFHPISFSTTP